MQITEFATENLLFIVEYCQIKHSYQLQYNNIVKVTNNNKSSDFVVINLQNKRKEDLYMITKPSKPTDHITVFLLKNELKKIELPSNIPKSRILKLYPNDIKKQIIGLYNKYFKSGSNYELNISYETRTKVDKVMMNQEIECIEYN